MKKILFLSFLIQVVLTNITYSQIPQGANGHQPTIESLLARVSNLESKVNALTEKLPFDDMAVLTLVSSEANMTSKTDQGVTIYDSRIKIDNPISNNNPKAIVFAINQAEANRTKAVNIVYDLKDGHWYITVPIYRINGFAPGFHLDRVLVNGTVMGREDKVTNMINSSGVPDVGPMRPKLGERFSVVIFKALQKSVKNILPGENNTVTPTGVDNHVQDLIQTTPQIFPVTGEWQCKFISASGSVFTGKVFLVVNETSVTGNLMVLDKTNPKITGTLINNQLSITRVTGLQTTQTCVLTRTDKNHFSGTYSNQGKYLDSGTVEFFR